MIKELGSNLKIKSKIRIPIFEIINLEDQKRTPVKIDKKLEETLNSLLMDDD